MSRIKGMVFDLDGTSIDLEKNHFDSFIAAAKECGIDLSFEELIANIPLAIGGGDVLIAEGLSALTGNAIPAGRFLSLKRKIYEEMLAATDIVLRPGAYKALCWIQKKGIPLSMGTLTPPHHTDILLQKTGLYAFFRKNLIVLREDVLHPKPAPDIYIETARRMRIDPKDQLVFEDSIPGILSARAAGSYAIAFPTHTFPKNLIGLIEAGAQRIFWDWREVNIEQLFKNI